MLFGDNKAAVYLPKASRAPLRCAILIRLTMLSLANVKKGALQVYWISGKDQLADGFTKPLARPAFEEKRRRIGVRDIRVRWLNRAPQPRLEVGILRKEEDLEDGGPNFFFFWESDSRRSVEGWGHRDTASRGEGEQGSERGSPPCRDILMASSDL